MNKKKQNTTSKTPRNFRSIKMLILEITTLPMLLACFLIAFFASWTMDEGMKTQILNGLKSTASGALLSLDNVSAEGFHLEGDDLYKGDFNLTQNMGSIDYYAASNDVEITFFYGNTRRATTLTDSTGARLVGTTVDSSVSDIVLKKGEPYASSDVIINGTPYYGYYMPISDFDSGKIIGWFLRAKNSTELQGT